MPAKITFPQLSRVYCAMARIECQLKLSKVSESFIEGHGGEKQTFQIARRAILHYSRHVCS